MVSFLLLTQQLLVPELQLVVAKMEFALLNQSMMGDVAKS